MVNKTKLNIFLSIVSVALFVVAIAAVSYAYFSNTIETDEKDETRTVFKSSKISAQFTDGATLNFQKMVPGDTFTKTFSVKNTGTQTISYKILLKDVTNTFISKSDITIAAKEGATPLKTITFPSANAYLSDTLTLAPGVTKNYSVTITYANTSSNQANDMNSTIKGKLFIEEVR